MTFPEVRQELVYISNKYPETLTLRLANTRVVTYDTFDDGMDGWTIRDGSWHHVTIDTNEDQSSGIGGGILMKALGSYYGGTVEKTLTFNAAGEIVFDYYVQNDGNVVNFMSFFINGARVLHITRPTAWQHSVVFGVPQGTHTFAFKYGIIGEFGIGHKAVVDNFKATTSKRMGGFIKDYKPPKAINGPGSASIVRGYTRFQEMKKSDTQIDFQMQMWGEEYLEFTRNQESIFYFTDEFGIIYRGRFNSLSTGQVALGVLYYFDLTMICDSDVGFGFADYSRQRRLT